MYLLEHDANSLLAQHGIAVPKGILLTQHDDFDPQSCRCRAMGGVVPFYATDQRTEGVLVIGEIGGHEEEEFAAAMTAHRFSKPVFALIAGRTAPSGVSMGHARALVHGSHGTFEAKKSALEAAGATVFDAQCDGGRHRSETEDIRITDPV